MDRERCPRNHGEEGWTKVGLRKESEWIVIRLKRTHIVRSSKGMSAWHVASSTTFDVGETPTCVQGNPSEKNIRCA